VYPEKVDASAVLLLHYTPRSVFPFYKCVKFVNRSQQHKSENENLGSLVLHPRTLILSKDETVFFFYMGAFLFDNLAYLYGFLAITGNE